MVCEDFEIKLIPHFLKGSSIVLKQKPLGRSQTAGGIAVSRTKRKRLQLSIVLFGSCLVVDK